jgi:transcriptional regulator with XRE-family HTH domain
MEKMTLKKYRDMSGLTQSKAAKALGITVVYFSDLERGVSKPGAKLAMKIFQWSGRKIDLNTLRPDIWRD